MDAIHSRPSFAGAVIHNIKLTIFCKGSYPMMGRSNPVLNKYGLRLVSRVDPVESVYCKLGGIVTHAFLQLECFGGTSRNMRRFVIDKGPCKPVSYIMI